MPGTLPKRFSLGLLAALYVEFALTGTVMTLLGPLMPSLEQNCGFSDARAGSLIAAQFIGNVLGALFATRNLRISLYAGPPLIAVGVAVVSFVPCSWLYVCTACYGVGLGLTISATNLLIASRYTVGRAASLMLANFVWGLGAVISPVLVGWASREHILSKCLLALAILSSLSWTAFLRSEIPSSDGVDHVSQRWYSPALLFFATLLFFYIGVETSIGSWTALYAERLPHGTQTMGFFSVGSFWAVLLLGRLGSAVLLRYLPETAVYAGGLGFLLAGNMFLLAARSSLQVLAGASITAIGLAPMFPLILSFASNSLLACRKSGWVFSMAAMGGAALPWLTGRVSTWSGSLRMGFMVPAGAAILILYLSLAGSSGNLAPALGLDSHADRG